MSRVLQSQQWCTDQARASREYVRLAREHERRPVHPGARQAARRYQRDAWAVAAACMLAWLLGGER